MKEMILSPSLLAVNYGKIEESVKRAQRAGAKWLHIDVMDGVFVPNLGIGVDAIKSIRKCTDIFFDVHLMIIKPERYIEKFAEAGADLISFHIEATEVPEECIQKIKSLGKKAGIVINPDTEVDRIAHLLDKVDMALVMSVFPGYGGQKYIESVNKKITQIREMMGEDFDIEVDGGVNEETAKMAKISGANILVAGTAVFNDNIEESVKKLL